MKKTILSLPFILIILLYSVSMVSALHQQEANCEYREIARTAVIKGEKCTIVNARGIDPSGRNWGCPLADDNSKLYTKINERTQCPSSGSTAPAPPTPALPVPVTLTASLPVIPETETAVRNYCLNKLSSESQDSCFNSIMNCVKTDNLTTCLTAYNPPEIALQSEAAPAQPPQVDITPSEAEIVRTPTEVWLQTADGEAMLPIEGGVVRFPINEIAPEINEIRVKIVFDKPDKDGSKESYRSFRVRRHPSSQPALASCNPNGEIDPATWQNEGMDCSSNDPTQRGQKWTCQGTVKFAYGESCPPINEEACWQMERNKCVSCGRSHTVERNICETSTQFNQIRTKTETEGQPDDLCIASFPTTFFRYECTGCKEARRVDKYCDGTTFIAQEGIEDIEECADRCPPLPTAPCEKEDLAYYCEGDEVAVYKFRDTDCQIQFTAVDCKDRGQVCSLGDCVNE